MQMKNYATLSQSQKKKSSLIEKPTEIAFYYLLLTGKAVYNLISYTNQERPDMISMAKSYRKTCSRMTWKSLSERSFEARLVLTSNQKELGSLRHVKGKKKLYVYITIRSGKL